MNVANGAHKGIDEICILDRIQFKRFVCVACFGDQITVAHETAQCKAC